MALPPRLPAPLLVKRRWHSPRTAALVAYGVRACYDDGVALKRKARNCVAAAADAARLSVDKLSGKVTDPHPVDMSGWDSTARSAYAARIATYRKGPEKRIPSLRRPQRSKPHTDENPARSVTGGWRQLWTPPPTIQRARVCQRMCR